MSGALRSTERALAKQHPAWRRRESVWARAAPFDADALDAEVELDVLTGGWFGARAARYGEPERPAANSPQPDERPGEAR